MSEQAGESEAVDLPAFGNEAFATLMDALVGDAEANSSGEEGAPADAAGAPAAGEAAADAAGGASAAAAGADGAGAAAGDVAGAEAVGSGTAGAADGGAEQPPASSDGVDRPAAWTAAAADITPKLGELSTKLEERTTQAYQNTALEEVQEEFGNYFDELNKHPRLMVGLKVPKIGGREGETEVLKDTNDAREWQEAVRSILVEEVKDRASRALEEKGDFLATVHQSIELFQNNVDLIPGTKGFDVDLANRFAKMVKPYELRVEGKLQGYSIPVQPIIEQLRTDLKAQRSAKPAAPVAADKPAAKKAAAPADPPQAGVPSKAGNSSSTEDFSTLFGTIGLPNLRI